MEAQEVEPDLVTYSLWISAHKRRIDKENPSAVSSDSIHNMEDNQTVTNKTRDELKSIFDIYEHMSKRNILPHIQFFNTWLQICKNSSGPSVVFEVFSEMKKARVQADYRTYDILLTVCAQTNRIEYGMNLFKTITHSNMPIDTQLANSLLRLPHVVYFNAQTSTEHEKMRAGQFVEQVLEMMKDRRRRPNLDTYQLLLSIYGRQENMDKVNETFSELEADGLRPTIKTYTALLTAFRNAQQIESAQTLYRSLVEKKFPMDPVFLRLLLKIMKEAKRMDYAEEIVQRLRTQEESAMAPRLQREQESRDHEAALRVAGRQRVVEYLETKVERERNREYKDRRLAMKADKNRERDVGRDREGERKLDREAERDRENVVHKQQDKGGRREQPQQTTQKTTRESDPTTDSTENNPTELITTTENTTRSMKQNNTRNAEENITRNMEEDNITDMEESNTGARARRTARQNAKLYSRNEDQVFAPDVGDALMKMALERHRAEHKGNNKDKKPVYPPDELQHLTPTSLEVDQPSPLDSKLPLEQLRLQQISSK